MSHIYLKVPQSQQIEIKSEHHAGSPQLIRFYHTPPGVPITDHRVLAWEAGWGMGGGDFDLVLGPYRLTDVDGEVALGVWHWVAESNNWAWNVTRVHATDSPSTNTPAVRTEAPVAAENADVTIVVETEDDGGSLDWNDTILTLTWPGRVIGALVWANDPNLAPGTFNWPEIDVFKNAHIYLDSLQTVAGGAAQVQFLGSGGHQDLYRGAPVVVPSAQRIRLTTRSAGAISYVARIVDKS